MFTRRHSGQVSKERKRSIPCQQRGWGNSSVKFAFGSRFLFYTFKSIQSVGKKKRKTKLKANW